MNKISDPTLARLRISILTGFVLLLCLGPYRIYKNAWRDGFGLAGMPLFGQSKNSVALPEIRSLSLPTDSEFGYDGQFYAQIALDPTLRRSEFDQALDSPPYRAFRIAMPTVAWILGLGNPLAIINSYTALNAIAWAALLVMLIKRFSPLNLRKAAAMAALLLTQGALTSITRATTDLPATTVLIAALFASGTFGRSAWFTIAVLTRETSVLSFLGMLQFRPISEAIKWRNWLPVASAVTVFGLWYLYVRLSFPGHTPPTGGNFALPFVGLFNKIVASWEQYSSNPNRYNLFEFLGPISLFVQALYLVIYRKLDCKVWRFGIPWVALFVCLGPWVWVEKLAFARTMLPLTFAFNLLLVLRPHPRPVWLFWFCVGNLGLCMSALELYHLLRG